MKNERADKLKNVSSNLAISNDLVGASIKKGGYKYENKYKLLLLIDTEKSICVF